MEERMFSRSSTIIPVTRNSTVKVRENAFVFMLAPAGCPGWLYEVYRVVVLHWWNSWEEEKRDVGQTGKNKTCSIIRVAVVEKSV